MFKNPFILKEFKKREKFVHNSDRELYCELVKKKRIINKSSQ